MAEVVLMGRYNLARHLWEEERRMGRHNHLLSEPCTKSCPSYHRRARPYDLL
jgi:hypothetical protein